MTRKYKNAYCMVCPAITDSSVITTTDRSYHSRLRHLSDWGMPAQGSSSYGLRIINLTLTGAVKTSANTLEMVFGS